VEGSASPLLAHSVSTSKSGSPVPTGEKLTATPSPMALDLPRNHDHPEALPIPEGECCVGIMHTNATLLNDNIEFLGCKI